MEKFISVRLFGLVAFAGIIMTKRLFLTRILNVNCDRFFRFVVISHASVVTAAVTGAAGVGTAGVGTVGVDAVGVLIAAKRFVVTSGVGTVGVGVVLLKSAKRFRFSILCTSNCECDHVYLGSTTMFIWDAKLRYFQFCTYELC